MGREGAQDRGAGGVPASFPGADGAVPPSAGAAGLRARPLARRLSAHLRRTGLLSPGEEILVAVSGGVDSVVLLYLLRFPLADWGFRLSAAHFDHRMRPRSDEDAAWVAGLCRAWGVPLVRGVSDSPLRSEAAAREARYRFLQGAAERVGARTIVTAHHADDQAETVLFRLIRGTGVRGLGGIPPRRGPFVRPLLPFRRSTIEAYAAAAGLRSREDPTNVDVRFARNRIRHRILPELEAIRPGAVEAIARLADEAREFEAARDRALARLESEAVVAEGPDRIVLARPVLLTYDPPTLAGVLRRILRRFGAIPGRGGTAAAVEFTNSGASGAGIQLAGGIRIEREFDRIVVRRGQQRATGAEARDRPLAIGGRGPGEGEAEIGGRRYRIRWGPNDARGGGGERFDPEALAFPLTVRGWRDGDRVRLPYGSKKLKKLFGEKRVARSDRDALPVIADAQGRILWVPGIARAAVAAPRPGRPAFRLVVEDGGPD